MAPTRTAAQLALPAPTAAQKRTDCSCWLAPALGLGAKSAFRRKQAVESRGCKYGWSTSYPPCALPFLVSRDTAVVPFLRSRTDPDSREESVTCAIRPKAIGPITVWNRERTLSFGAIIVELVAPFSGVRFWPPDGKLFSAVSRPNVSRCRARLLKALV